MRWIICWRDTPKTLFDKPDRFRWMVSEKNLDLRLLLNLNLLGFEL
jgi:hypothetical protein